MNMVVFGPAHASSIGFQLPALPHSWFVCCCIDGLTAWHLSHATAPNVAAVIGTLTNKNTAGRHERRALLPNCCWWCIRSCTIKQQWLSRQQ